MHRMPKASFVLPNGTTVAVDGTTGEIQRLLSIYASDGQQAANVTAKPALRRETRREAEASHTDVDLSEIVNIVRTCAEAEGIERNVLDSKSLVDRTLLPLYIVHQYLGNAYALTSGQVSHVTADLGIPVRGSHASTTLSATAARFVVSDMIRKKGVAVHYKLSRRGLQYMQAVVTKESPGRETS
jgi:hypothetical protein